MTIEWNDENRAELVKQYLAKNPTSETSMEIVAELAKEFDTTPNGARMILSRKKVYITKAKDTSTTTSTDKKESKADSVARLNAEIKALGLEPDNTIIDKLTGKAAAYFADVIKTATEEDEEDE